MTQKNKDGAGPEIATFAVGELQAAQYNPRVMSDEAMAGLRHSLERFGCVEPVVVNTYRGRRTIVGGHQRVKALQAMGVEQVTCVVVKLPPAEEKLLNVTLNNPHIQGQFIEKLDEFIASLQEQIGDDKAMMDLRINALIDEIGEEPERVGLTKDDEIPKVPKKAITCKGDLWKLGEHRLLCGDSTQGEDVARLMGNEKAVLFATDPPYGVSYTGNDRPTGGRDWSNTYHEIATTGMLEFYRQYITMGLAHVEENAAMYLWHANNQRKDVEDICDELDILMHQLIIWVKPTMVMGYSCYCWSHEPCIMMWRRGHKPPMKTGGKIKTVWTCGLDREGDPTSLEYYSDIWELDWEGKKRASGIGHPTVKPVEIFAIPMRVHTQPGDLCYEPFSGSGTQIIAAEKLGRRCYAIETEPVFVDVAVQRWEQWTGKKAERIKA